MSGPHHIYTADQIAWLRIYRGKLQITELADQFNQRFGTGLSNSAINGKCKKLKISAGGTGRFQPGQKPHNTGKKGVRASMATEFKKGQMPHNYVPVGTERMKSIGYVAVKIADPNQWQFKHILTWEAEHGPVPKNHVIIFKDGDRLNFDHENLVLISRPELLQMSRNRYLQQPDEIKPVVMTLSKLQVAIFKKTNPKRKDAECHVS